jgi:hypothetical protein
MIRTRSIWCVLIVALVGLFVLPTAALAQTRQVNASDQRRTERIIRNIDKFESDGILSMNRTATAVEQLLDRLRVRGVDPSALDAVANHYSRTVSAIRVRQQARINALYLTQLRSLQSVNGAEDLISQLTAERDAALAAMIDTENNSLGQIADAISAG